jgi:hypothetical protein
MFILFFMVAERCAARIIDMDPLRLCTSGAGFERHHVGFTNPPAPAHDILFIPFISSLASQWNHIHFILYGCGQICGQNH